MCNFNSKQIIFFKTVHISNFVALFLQWINYWVVLHGFKLCFFKNENTNTNLKENVSGVHYYVL